MPPEVAWQWQHARISYGTPHSTALRDSIDAFAYILLPFLLST